jgi:hypothetical protein
MAASSEKNDYVHILMDKILSYNTEAVFMLETVVDFETGFWNYDISKTEKVQCFNADMIIMRIAENVNDEEAGKIDFGSYYAKLIYALNPSQKAVIVCTSSFWDNPNVNAHIKKVSDENGFLFVDLSELKKDKQNMAINEFEDVGVGLHPSDIGMERITALIWDKVKSMFE